MAPLNVVEGRWKICEGQFWVSRMCRVGVFNNIGKAHRVSVENQGMSMTRQSIAEELESAAGRIADISRADLQIILRRAALMLRNVKGVPLEPIVEDAVDSIASEMKIGRSEFIQIIVRQWLETNAYLPARLIDRQSQTNGND